MRSACGPMRVLGVAALLGTLLARPAAGQVPWRGGLWMDAGVGYGRLRLTCGTCTGIAAADGTEYTISVGGAPSRNVLLGVQGPVSPQVSDTTPATVQGTGITLDLGAGYDLPVSRHLGVAVQAAWHIAALGDLTVNGQNANDVIANVYRIGLAVVLR